MEIKPPRKWELWVAAFLLLIYLANNSRDGGPDNVLVNDMFAFVSIGWFISIGVRLSRFKKAQAARAKEIPKEGQQ